MPRSTTEIEFDLQSQQAQLKSMEAERDSVKQLFILSERMLSVLSRHGVTIDTTKNNNLLFNDFQRGVDRKIKETGETGATELSTILEDFRSINTTSKEETKPIREQIRQLNEELRQAQEKEGSLQKTTTAISDYTMKVQAILTAIQPLLHSQNPDIQAIGQKLNGKIDAFQSKITKDGVPDVDLFTSNFKNDLNKGNTLVLIASWVADIFRAIVGLEKYSAHDKIQKVDTAVTAAFTDLKSELQAFKSEDAPTSQETPVAEMPETPRHGNG